MFMLFGDKELTAEFLKWQKSIIIVLMCSTRFLICRCKSLIAVFPETSTKLLLGVACLNPIDSFSNWDKEKIFQMAQLYPNDFDELVLRHLVVNKTLLSSMCMIMRGSLIEGNWWAFKEIASNEEAYDLSSPIFTCEVGFTFISFHFNYWKGILSNKDHQDQFVQSNIRWVFK